MLNCDGEGTPGTGKGRTSVLALAVLWPTYLCDPGLPAPLLQSREGV